MKNTLLLSASLVIWPIIVSLLAVKFFVKKTMDSGMLVTILETGAARDEFNRDSFKGVQSETILRLFGAPATKKVCKLLSLSEMPPETFFAEALFAFRNVDPSIDVELWHYPKADGRDPLVFVIDINGNSEVLASSQGEKPPAQ
jgi:hypothetical protein